MRQLGRLASLAMIGAVVSGAPTRVDSQAAPVQPQQVISANPFGLLLDLFNAEYERKVSESATAGIGGSYFSRSDEYVNADVFYRFYPNGKPFDGWAFGVKAGVTRVSDWSSYFGYGFDVNRSWVLGKNQNFYVGLGFGLKKLVRGGDDPGGLEYIPTFRIVNVGIAF